MFALLVAVVSVPAHAQEEVPTADAGPADESPADATRFDCQAGPWTFDGAKWESGPEVAYKESWSETLIAIASCAPQIKRSGACFEVQGHFDGIPFGSTVVRIFGSTEAAQQARGRGRANSILQKLGELGVPSTMLHEVSPGVSPTFRGAKVRIANGCSTDLDALEERYRAVISEELGQLRREQISPDEYARRAAIAMGQAQNKQAPTESPLPSAHKFWLGGGLDASALFLFPGTDDVYGPVLRLGGGWHNEQFYGTLLAGASLGSEVEERAGLEGLLSAGYYRNRWVQVGLAFEYRVASSGANTPWIDRTWSVAIEAHQCPWTFGNVDVCLQEAFSPVGGHVRRAEYSDTLDSIELIDQRSNSLIRLDLGVVARMSL